MVWMFKFTEQNVDCLRKNELLNEIFLRCSMEEAGVIKCIM